MHNQWERLSGVPDNAVQWVQHLSYPEIAVLIASVFILVLVIYREVGENRRNARVGVRERNHKPASKASRAKLVTSSSFDSRQFR
jgi:hypothetical protein